MKVADAIQFLEKTFSFDENSLVGVIRPDPPSKKKPSTIAIKPKNKARHVVWNPDAEGYVLLRKGISVKNESELELLYKENKIQEAHFFIFKNKDPNLERNKTVPLYEAGYFCTETNYFLRVQKCHLKQGYTNSGRTDNEKMWEIQDINIPYWVDRYIFCKTSQYKSKNKYENKNK